MKASATLIDLLKELEGFREHAYLCSADVWTFGYGSTKHMDFSPVQKGDKVHEDDAIELLMRDINHFGQQVSRLVQVPLTQNQFDALVSFAYNLGGGALQQSTLLEKLNTGNYAAAAREFDKWDKARDAKTGKMRVIAGLTNRRKAERELFLNDIGYEVQAGQYQPNPNNTPLRNRDLPLPTAYQEHGVDSVKASNNTGKIAAVTTTGVAGAGGIATMIADPQIITPATISSGLAFLQAVDWRVAIVVVLVVVVAALWIRGRR